uniref:Chromo domain-containing protein n=1 Tax=Lotharella oceanica TaxID=641309 RepID=A0A7S2TUB3_9EUKA|mmetsp:Transcript_2785/g.5305  ORF Transcript_2785/g.5305 Transcript_2785/m.5305 type:complete len:330 (+) Transcript_2785:70-1059(+)
MEQNGNSMNVEKEEKISHTETDRTPNRDPSGKEQLGRVDGERIEKPANPDKADEVGKEDHNEFEVDVLIGHRKEEQQGKVEFLVKWRGYGEEESTWEPIENVHPELVVEYFLVKLNKLREAHQMNSQVSTEDAKMETEGLRDSLGSMSRQLKRTEKVCQNLGAENQELRMTVSELVDENESLKKNSKAHGSSTGERILKVKNKALEKQNSSLTKEVNSLRTQLRVTRGKLQRHADSHRIEHQRSRVKDQRLIRKIEQAIFAVTKGKRGKAPSPVPLGGVIGSGLCTRRKRKSAAARLGGNAMNGDAKKLHSLAGLSGPAGGVIEDPAFL